jgi:F-type H+-transporting ATPase subunit epsilon
MADKIELEIVTPKGRALLTKAEMVTVPGIDGEFGVLPGARPTLTGVGIGVLTYQNGSETKKCGVRRGFAEGGPERLVILTDDFAEASEVDPVQVLKRMNEVEKEVDAMFNNAERTEASQEEKAKIADLHWLATQLSLQGEAPNAAFYRLIEDRLAREDEDNAIVEEGAAQESTEAAG